MIKARLHRMATGHILATFKSCGTITGTRVVGGPNDKLGVAARHVATNFNVDQVGIAADALGPNCVATYGHTVWMKPGFHLG